MQFAPGEPLPAGLSPVAMRLMYPLVRLWQRLISQQLALHVQQLWSLRASNAVAWKVGWPESKPRWLPCRPAATEALDSSMPAIGCPAYVPMASKDAPSGVGLFFVSVQETMRGNSARSQVGSGVRCESM